jgi:hypothetical protein
VPSQPDGAPDIRSEAAMTVLELLLVAWLPGAVLFRIPRADRDRRAALPVEERLFWAVVLAITWSLMVVLALALSGEYTFQRLLAVNAAVAAVPIVTWRRRLLYNGQAARPSWTALVPLGIALFGAWLFLPPSEYVMGGKDPGVYLNEGIQIAQRGRIVIEDPVVGAVPAAVRELFFPSYRSSTYYGVRFMGFFLQDPDAGTVIGQFPHLFPASVALGYGLHGLSGARQTVVVWAVLGLLAVYFVASRIAGRTAAAAAVLLLSVNVIEIWFARYPNTEMAMQALLFAGMLAFVHGLEGGQRFFGPVAGALIGLQLFLRYDAIIAIGTFAASAVLAWFNRQHIGWRFPALLVPTTAAAFWYLATLMRAYSEGLFGYTRDRGGWWLLAAAGILAAGARALARSETWAARVRRAVPVLLALAIAGLAAYAYFIRTAGGTLTTYDADAFRTFAWFVTPFGLLGGVAGIVLLVGKGFWKFPVFFLTAAAFGVFFFYKARIVPEHFWMERRFLAAALPAVLIGLAALPGSLAALGIRLSGGRRTGTLIAHAAGGIAWVLVAAVGWSTWRASTPVRTHIEYAGMIPRLEDLAARFGPRDLVLVESRNASDLHVMALPLAYVYARNVLVLHSPRPSKPMFEDFMAWARQNYSTIFFLGGGGTDLLTRGMTAEPVASERFQVPEYESAREAYPSGVRHKEFDYGLYRLVPAAFTHADTLSLSIGLLDDLNVVRFHAKEKRADTGMVYRWSRDVSYVTFPAIGPETREVIVWMSSGGRPERAAKPVVEVSLEEDVVGEATPIDDVRPYAFRIPPAVATRLSSQTEPVRIRLRVPTWNPQAVLGVPDSRDLGVVVTRVDLQ